MPPTRAILRLARDASASLADRHLRCPACRNSLSETLRAAVCPHIVCTSCHDASFPSRPSCVGQECPAASRLTGRVLDEDVVSVLRPLWRLHERLVDISARAEARFRNEGVKVHLRLRRPLRAVAGGGRACSLRLRVRSPRSAVLAEGLGGEVADVGGGESKQVLLLKIRVRQSRRERPAGNCALKLRVREKKRPRVSWIVPVKIRVRSVEASSPCDEDVVNSAERIVDDIKTSLIPDIDNPSRETTLIDRSADRKEVKSCKGDGDRTRSIQLDGVARNVHTISKELLQDGCLPCPSILTNDSAVNHAYLQTVDDDVRTQTLPVLDAHAVAKETPKTKRKGKKNTGRKGKKAGVSKARRPRSQGVPLSDTPARKVVGADHRKTDIQSGKKSGDGWNGQKRPGGAHEPVRDSPSVICQHPSAKRIDMCKLDKPRQALSPISADDEAEAASDMKEVGKNEEKGQFGVGIILDSYDKVNFELMLELIGRLGGEPVSGFQGEVQPRVMICEGSDEGMVEEAIARRIPVVGDGWLAASFLAGQWVETLPFITAGESCG